MYLLLLFIVVYIYTPIYHTFTNLYITSAGSARGAGSR